MVKRSAAFYAGFSTAFSLITASAYAGPVVPDGLRLYFSPRGQDYFRDHLNAVLLANALDLSKTHWDVIKFPVGGPLKDPFRDGDRPAGEAFRALHSEVAPYFYGFRMNPPKLEVKLADSDLSVKFTAVGAAIDPAGPAAYGNARSSGLVLLMRLEAEGLRFDVNTLRLNDLANPGLLGALGANAFSTKLVDGDLRPVKVELPVLVEANGRRATMRVLSIRTNLQKTRFESAFERVVTPSLKVVIDEKEYPFDANAFERDIRAQLPSLNDAIIAAVKAYFERDGKTLIQPSFDSLARSLNVDFKLPLSSDPKSEKDLMIHLRPKATEYTASRHLGLTFDAEIEDPKFEGGKGLFETPGSARSVDRIGEDASAYDLAVAIHPAAVNGLLNRVWAKGILRDIDMGKDDSGKPTKVKIPKAPTVSFEGLPSANQARFHAAIGYVVRGLSGVLFKGPIPITLDLVANLETNAKNEIEVVLDHIDESTLAVDVRAAWLGPIRGKVDAMVREKVAKLNRDAKAERKLLTALPTLDELIGIPLQLGSARTEAGSLVLLAAFAPRP